MSSQRQQGAGRKSRIVVDVERVQAEAQSKRRGGRSRRILSITALAVAGLLLVLLVGAYAWWQSYKTGPAYSVALLLDAAQRDDLQAVESMIDADSVAQGFIPQVIEKLTAPGAPLPPQARAQLTAALPQLLPRVRETMREEVTQVVKEAAGQGGHINFVLLAFGVSRIADIKETGDAATVSAPNGDYVTEVSMRRSGDQWKVVGVRDDKMATRIATRLAASLPAAAPQPQGQQRRSGRQ